MAARAGGGNGVGELSEALRAEIEKAVGKMVIEFSVRPDFGNAGAVFLAEKLHGNMVVEELSFQLCRIGATGARALGEALAEDNITLNNLNLHGNISLADDGAEAMAQVLRKNTTLKQLGLGICSVTDRGARALGEALKENFTLKRLDLSSNHFGDDGAHALAEALRWNESLGKLDLGNCQLTDVGASYLLAALRESNSTLTELWLGGNCYVSSSEIRASIGKLLKENKAVVPATAERRARCLLFCCLQLAPKAHEHAVPSIGAVPVPVMRYSVEHAACLHVAKRFEHANVVAAEQSSASVRARSSSSLPSSGSLYDLEPATARRR